MISCPYCSTQNPEGALYCDECGANLKSTAALGTPGGPGGSDTAVSPDDAPPFADAPPMVEPTPAYVPPVAERFPDLAEIEGPATGFTPTNITSVGTPLPPIAPSVAEAPAEPPAFLSAAQTVVAGGAGNAAAQPDATEADEPAGNVHATLLIERGAAVGKVFSLTNDETYIGRWDADNGVFPDVDLDTHDPEAKVSRRHARIVLKDGIYTLEDLGSTNGTFINRGRRLLPGNPNILNEGDEIIIGKTFMRFQIGKQS